MNYQSVLRTINSTDPDTAYLVVADQNGKQQTIVSDSKHPYFAQYGTDPTPPEPSPGKPYHGDIANAYWVNAANLEAGHKLIDDSGNWQTVVSVRVEPKLKTTTPSSSAAWAAMRVFGCIIKIVGIIYRKEQSQQEKQHRMEDLYILSKTPIQVNI